MTAPVFVDTNVFVYAREAGDATRQPRALSWVEWLWREQLGRTSMQVLSEYYVTVTRKLKPGLPPEQAWDDIDALMAWNPQPIDRDVMQRARAIQSRHRLSWWDSLVVAAARAQGCAVLLTEDLHNGALIDGVRIRNPFTHAVHDIGIEAYGAPAAPRRSGDTRRVPR
ncbi:MAG: PIN domain-containing protein [Burkholderiaceae bacterium]|nr:PIN domain-containing protein [Burkholderiaceae bacterium]